MYEFLLEKSRQPMSYINFCLKKHKDPPVLFTISIEKEVYAMACDGIQNSFDIIHPTQIKLIVLYKNNEFPLSLRFQEPFVCDCKWANIPTEPFVNL